MIRVDPHLRPPDLRHVRRRAVERRRTAKELRQASEAGEFSLSFQPRRALRDGGLCGAEASIRWPRRKAGLTPGGSLVPLLEGCGLILPTMAWMLRAVCEQALIWPDPMTWVVSLDAPASLLADGTLAVLVAEALALSGLSPGRLEIEIDEADLDRAPDETLLTLCALRDLGVGVALDHFGSASAGLLTLKRLPLTAVKLDRAMIRDLPTDADAVATAASVIGLAHALDMRVVAVGVDTEAQGRTLRELGCDEGQGALFGGQVTPELWRATLAGEHIAA